MAKKKNMVSSLIVIGVIILALAIIFLRTSPSPVVSAELAQCIGNHSVMYSQTGCHYCKQQKDMFGDNVKYLNVIECDLNSTICNQLGIQGTPTWIINGKQYVGVQTIDQLKNLTGC
jgi:glutaredoxin